MISEPLGPAKESAPQLGVCLHYMGPAVCVTSTCPIFRIACMYPAIRFFKVLGKLEDYSHAVLPSPDSAPLASVSAASPVLSPLVLGRI